MCSINGFFKTRQFNDEGNELFNKLVNSICINSTQRGLDGLGITSLYFSGLVDISKFVTKNELGGIKSREEKLNFIKSKLDLDTSNDKILICNLRAEPTTESLDITEKSDIQPFNYESIWAVHNGTIPNDKQLLKDIEVPTRVDSYAIPYCVYENRLDELDGAIATAWFDEDKPGSLHLAKNYAPLSLFYLYDFNAYIFTSLDEFAVEVFTKELIRFNKITFEPFTQVEITDEGYTFDEFLTVEKSSTEESKTKAVVVCSGGLDSTVSATLACSNPKIKSVVLAHFMYGCKAENKEIEAVKAITTYLQNKYPEKEIKCEFMDLSFIKNLGGSTLTDGSDSDIGKPIEGSEKDIDWVPARNTAFMGLIAAYCDRYNIGNIYLGINLEEGGAYRDNQTMFMKHWNEVLMLGCHSKPQIISSLENMVKHEIVELGVRIGAPLHLTWSCYRNGDKPCGNCGPCQLRQTAFHINGIREVQEYEHYFFEDVKPL